MRGWPSCGPAMVKRHDYCMTCAKPLTGRQRRYCSDACSLQRRKWRREQRLEGIRVAVERRAEAKAQAQVEPPEPTLQDRVEAALAMGLSVDDVAWELGIEAEVVRQLGG